MSTPYGFRVFVMTAHENKVKDRDPVDAHQDSDLPDEMLDLLERLSGSTYFFEPRPRDADDDRPVRPTVSVTVDEPVKVNRQLVVCKASTGYVGAHREATHPSQRSVALGDYSAEAEYFLSFHFPKFGDRFFLVAQTYNRHDMAERLVSLIKRTSLEKRRTADAADKAARDLARENGDKVPRKEVFTRLAFAKHQATDDAYLDEILGAAKSISATFTSIAPDDRGGDGKRVERTLTIKLATETGQETGLKISRLWKQKQRENEPSTRRDGVSELGAELSERGLLSSGEADGYDNSRLNVTPKNGPSTTIAVDTLKDVFTYPVSEGKPDGYYFYKAVSDRLSKIALQEDIEIDDLDAEEIESCLDDLT